KLRALSCLLEQADDREEWLQALDRPVPLLRAQVLPADARDLDRWSVSQGLDAAAVRRLNPAFANGRIARASTALRVLAPLGPGATDVQVAIALPPSLPTPATPDAILADAAGPIASGPVRSHTVARGDSLWAIAHHYGIATSALIARNKLDAKARLKPGMVLRIDDEPAAAP
ncbi:MAG TPA: LysM peptidoglycan-binding domain-containing protein, partial [Luteimonas sp.]|nr:LysM peptidoglycan-binding domain-containing protein [Luteimonas sp.]